MFFRARLTYAVTYSMTSSLDFSFLIGVIILLGGMDITFFEDLEAETIHVCIAWALLKYLGLFYLLLLVFASCFHGFFLVPVYRFGDW